MNFERNVNFDKMLILIKNVKLRVFCKMWLWVWISKYASLNKMWILGTFLARKLQLLTLPFDFAMNTIDWKSQVRKCRFFQFDILEFDFWSDRDWSVWKLQILSQFGIKERCEYCRHHRCFLKTTTGLIRTTESCYSYQFVRFFFFVEMSHFLFRKKFESKLHSK